jgi:hypothetical protein
MQSTFVASRRPDVQVVSRGHDSRLMRHTLLRRGRRRKGVIWAVMACIALLVAWDASSRIDQVAYNETSSR